MNKAIVGVCYDARQRRILEITFPSWQLYARRHGVPIKILERSCAGEDYYWNKHILFRAPELRGVEIVLFLDNDVFVNRAAGGLLDNWNSELIGATSESGQAAWSPAYVKDYYNDYGVVCTCPLTNTEILNTGVLVIPRAQADFLERVYQQWQQGKSSVKRAAAGWRDPFAAAADQPHVSYALQAEKRYRDFGPHYNTLWWHWYRRHVSPRQTPFLLRSKAAALMIDRLPKKLWNIIFRRERALFARGLAECDFLHVAGSKSALFLGDGYGP